MTKVLSQRQEALVAHRQGLRPQKGDCTVQVVAYAVQLCQLHSVKHCSTVEQPVQQSVGCQQCGKA